jgi:hypothetical protein
MITAAAWNRFIARRRRERLRSVTTLSGGTSHHPWHTTLAWNSDLERWEASIKPGFVDNGRMIDVTVHVPVSSPPGLPVSESSADVPLTSFPRLPITTFRSVGTDSVSIDGGGEKVPEFFLARGVRAPVSLVTDTESGIKQQVEGLLASQESARLLRACDLVLQHDRVATATEWQITPAETGAQAQFSVIYKTAPGARSGAYIRTQSRYTSISPVDDLTRLQGEWEDQTFDSQHLATVWLLSPAGAPLESGPDETWEPHVEYKLFWNAIYETTTPAPGVVKQNLEVNLAGLGNAAGAQITVNQILSSQNDSFNNALTFLNANQISGRFVTPGPSVPPKWDKTRSLNPPFPFLGLPAES